MRIFENYTRAEYEDYYDFKKNFRLQAPETFNFAYDVMDKLAEEKPDKVAMIWLGRSGEEKRFTFRDFRCCPTRRPISLRRRVSARAIWSY